MIKFDKAKKNYCRGMVHGSFLTKPKIGTGIKHKHTNGEILNVNEIEVLQCLQNQFYPARTEIYIVWNAYFFDVFF